MITLRNDAEMHIPGQVRNLSRQWEQVLHMGTKITYRKNEQFSFSEQNQADFCYLHSGRLYTLHPSLEGNERIVLFVNAGCLFRETFVASGFCNSIPIHHCLADVEIYRFNGKLLFDKEFEATYPHLIRNVIYSLAVKLNGYDAMLGILSKKKATQKLAYYIYMMYNYHQKLSFSPEISQNDLALLLGIHKSSMNRAVIALKNMGILQDFTKNRLTIVDKEKLKQVITGR